MSSPAAALRGFRSVVDFDETTGELIDPLSSTYQDTCVVLSTRLASVWMLREYGAGVVELLGRRITPPLFGAYKQLVCTAIDIWVVRFRVRRIVATGSIEDFRLGHLTMDMEVDYRPRAHLGDPTVERVVPLNLLFNRNDVSVVL